MLVLMIADHDRKFASLNQQPDIVQNTNKQQPAINAINNNVIQIFSTKNKRN